MVNIFYTDAKVQVSVSKKQNWFSIKSKEIAYVFPDLSKPQSEWKNEFEVTCEWENKWSHSIVPHCIDPRGCDLPPQSTKQIYASYHHDSEIDEYLPVGTLVWYQCKDGNYLT